MNATCDSCRWWEDEHEDPEGSGICRRYAPKPRVFEDSDVGPKYPIWPLTLNTEWCGEHQHKPAAGDA